MECYGLTRTEATTFLIRAQQIPRIYHHAVYERSPRNIQKTKQTLSEERYWNTFDESELLRRPYAPMLIFTRPSMVAIELTPRRKSHTVKNAPLVAYMVHTGPDINNEEFSLWIPQDEEFEHVNDKRRIMPRYTTEEKRTARVARVALSDLANLLFP